MSMSAAARRLTLWIASLAILLAALAPAVLSMATTSGSSSAPWHEICTSSGLLVSAADEQTPSPVKSIPAKHCPWCSHHTWLALLPPATQLLVRLTPADQLVVRPPDRPPLRGAPPHHPAAPRGPPVIS